VQRDESGERELRDAQPHNRRQHRQSTAHKIQDLQLPSPSMVAAASAFFAARHAVPGLSNCHAVSAIDIYTIKFMALWR
jgi:hypothetical protein